MEHSSIEFVKLITNFFAYNIIYLSSEAGWMTLFTIIMYYEVFELRDNIQ